MSDGLDLAPDVRAAVVRVQDSSASEVTSERFRLQLRQEITNAGGDASDGVLDGIVAAMAQGTFSRY